MIRTVIHIDEGKCMGCGLCADVCHEGAIGMVDGKAKLLRDDFCDGMGDCLPSCPADAISFVEREALPYDEAAVAAAQAARSAAAPAAGHFGHGGGCPGSRAQVLHDTREGQQVAPTAGELNDIRSVTICRMEVPCCGGLERAAENALAASGKNLPIEVVTFSVRGEVL